MFQLFLRLCSACSLAGPALASFCFCEASTSLSFLSFSFSLLDKSKVALDPGVFGVLDWPNDAKAPVPSPKAPEAPTPGDFAEEGEAALKGFDLPCDEESPNLRPANPRGESVLPPSLVSRSLVGNESLSLLLDRC